MTTLAAGATTTYRWSGSPLPGTYAISAGGGAAGGVQRRRVLLRWNRGILQRRRLYRRGRRPGATYRVRLHFNEFFWTQVGQRVFDVAINGAQVLSRFDIIAATGGQNRATVREFAAAADANGRITVQFSTIVDNAKPESTDEGADGLAPERDRWIPAKVSGIEIIPRSHAVNAGGGASGASLGDRFFSGGTPASSSAAVSTAGVTNPAPQAVYQSERYGSFSFGASGLQPGRTYTVRLHFNSPSPPTPRARSPSGSRRSSTTPRSAASRSRPEDAVARPRRPGIWVGLLLLRWAPPVTGATLRLVGNPRHPP